MKRTQLSLVMSLCFGLVGGSFAVEPELKAEQIITPEPAYFHGMAIMRTMMRFTQSHYHKFDLDDAFSERIFNRYIDWLDPAHNTFLQSDIDEMRAKYAHIIDDAMFEGGENIAFEIYDLMSKRRYQRYHYALSLLDNAPDLSGQEHIENDRTKAPFPKTEAEANALWMQRVKNDVIGLSLKDKKWAEIKKTLTKRYNLAIKRLTQVKADDILQSYLNAFSREIDPHTSYLSPRTAKSFQESMNLSLEGIGATLEMDDDVTTVKSLVPGAPAARSKKIEVGDKIVGVGQAANKIEEVIGWRIDDVVDKIKGKKGTKVYLEIEPAKGGKTKIVTLVRDKVRLEDSAAKLTFDNVDNKNIAVIKIPSFYIGLTKDVRKLLTQMKSKKVDGLILDLRENGGGSLTEVVELTGLFIDKGPVVQVRDAFNHIKVHNDPHRGTEYNGKMMVMINRHSASASEILAAALQDYNRAIIVGQQSFGKGTVQQSRSLNFVYDRGDVEMGVVQYTIQKFYRINGGSTQLKGVEPDIKLPEIINAEKTGESFEDNALAWDKIPAVKYDEGSSLRKTVMALTEKHHQRIATHPEFIWVKEEIALNRERDNQKFTSLNLNVRKQENTQRDTKRLNDLNARFKREGKALLKRVEDLPKNYEAPDFFLKETENMMVDWLKISK